MLGSKHVGFIPSGKGEGSGDDFLIQADKSPKIVSFVGGLGGRDITVAGFEEMVGRGVEIARKGSSQEFEIFGVRE